MQILENKKIIIISLIIMFIISIISILLMVYYKNKECICNIPVFSEVKEITYDNNKIHVDIKGAVKKTGVYEIEENSMVIDAINIAGGLNKNAYTNNLNLSKKVTDEMVIYVYTKSEINKQNKKEEITECICPDLKCNDNVIDNNNNNNNNNISYDLDKNSSLVNINTASKELLLTVNGIGDKKADAIIEYRQKNGLFKNIEDVKNVTGVGDAMYEKIKEFITV